jgi:GNAT superfamily N-acetyltransferase
MIEGYYLSDRNEDMNIDSVHRFLSQSYWAEAIPLEILTKAISNSLCFGVFHKAGEQVGFARIVTDHATFAYLCDVYIEELHRGLGLSKWLMEFVHHHPSLTGLRRTVLVTRDAHALYEQFGYTGLHNPSGYMENWNPNVYKNR